MSLTLKSKICKDIVASKCFAHRLEKVEFVKNKKTGRLESQREKVELTMDLVLKHAREVSTGNRSPFTCSHVELGNYYIFVSNTDHYLKCLGVCISRDWTSKKVFTIFCNSRLNTLRDYPFIKLVNEYDGNSGYVWVYMIDAHGLVEWLGEKGIELSPSFRQQMEEDDEYDDEDN